MADPAISGALDRLDAALERLDQTVDGVLMRATLHERDDILRAEVRAVIAELDRMIGGQHG